MKVIYIVLFFIKHISVWWKSFIIQHKSKNWPLSAQWKSPKGKKKVKQNTLQSCHTIKIFLFFNKNYIVLINMSINSIITFTSTIIGNRLLEICHQETINLNNRYRKHAHCKVNVLSNKATGSPVGETSPPTLPKVSHTAW